MLHGVFWFAFLPNTWGLPLSECSSIRRKIQNRCLKRRNQTSFTAPPASGRSATAGCLFSLHLHPQLLAVRSQLDPAVPISAQQSVALQGIQHLGVRPAAQVAGAHTEQDQLRVDAMQPGGRVERGQCAGAQAGGPTFLPAERPEWWY